MILRSLLDYTPINKNLCNIIFQYINYSLDNLLEIQYDNFNKYINSEYSLKDGISMIDILVMCVRFGCKGFYIYKDQHNLVKFINILVKTHNNSYENDIKIYLDSDLNEDSIFYYLKYIGKCIHLLELNVIENV
jgi:hypothetical protein